MSAIPQTALLRTLSPRAEELAGRITAFMEAHVYPAERYSFEMSVVADSRT